ncbi:PEP-CTERM sorting domain-containing protein [Gemmatimonas sp.]|uniref:PEP-CTERM sorting domain-containing protein n=1 Tax=Gemmatimonas sp. TaxID=1962908 RepID=UPI003983A19F
MMIKRFLGLSALMVAVSVPATVRAQLTSTSPACNAAGVFAAFNPQPIACLGAYSSPSNNVGSALVTNAMGTAWGGIWSEVGTTNAGSSVGPFNNVLGATTGTLNFDIPISGVFAIVLKSQTFSVYLFNVAGAPISSLQFTMAGTSLNNKGELQELSHATLYSGVGGSNSNCITGGGNSCLSNVVPEPSTYALMTAGLIGIFGAARRRRVAKI